MLDILSQRHYVYTLAYPDGRVFYVGEGQDNRIDDHEQQARRVPLVHSRKCNTIRKIWADGEQVVKKKESHFESVQDALTYEIALIFFMRPYGTITNLTDGGEGLSGLEFSEAHRQKIGDANKRRVITEVTRQKMRLARTNTHHTKATRQKMSSVHTGKKLPSMSEAQKLKLSEAHTGMHPSEVTRQKMSESRKGKPLSQEHRKNLTIARHNRAPISEITRQRIGQASSNRSEETLRKMSESAKRRTQRVRDSNGRYIKRECAS